MAYHSDLLEKARNWTESVFGLSRVPVAIAFRRNDVLSDKDGTRCGGHWSALRIAHPLLVCC